MKNTAFIFDLDGTLIDSLLDIALCANKVLEEFSLPTHSLEDYKYFVGGGALVLIENCIPKDLEEDKTKAVLKRFIELYDTKLQNNTKPYDGIIELLSKLDETGIKIGILSNKPHEFTLEYAKKFFGDFNISEIHGQKEDVPKKPNPIAAINIAKSFDIPYENIYFVGDTSIDMKTAKSANMKAVGVSWGFRPVKELIENGADYIAKTPKDILSLIK